MARSGARKGRSNSPANTGSAPSDELGRAGGQDVRALVVDDAEGVRSFLADLLELRGYRVDTAGDGRSALALLKGGASPDIVILDVMMPGIDGLETLRRIRDLDASLPVIMLSVVGKVGTIVRAMQLGATDYLNKPIDEDQLQASLLRALERRALEVRRERQRRGPLSDPDATVWHSPRMKKVREVIEQISDTDITVLIQGESGTGKEIIARAVHHYSSRVQKPFVKVNCAALPEELLESELFGYERGAFTGAISRKQGKFEIADGGTIFLDEIGEMSTNLQAKLLQVLQDSEFTRLGGHREVRVDVRVVCATNQLLRKMVEQRTFREDLYFRLNVVNIEIPPLRDRREEIPLFVETFLERYRLHYQKPPRSLSDPLLEAFGRYPFPGNVRELENMIKRILVLESEDSILEELARKEAGEQGGRSVLHALLKEVEESAGEIPLREVGRRIAQQAERETIERALRRTSWNRKQAAKLLKVSYKTLLQKIRDCGLEARS